MARPKKTLEILPKQWQEDILNLYEAGASDVEIRAYLTKNCKTFSTDLWNRFIDEEEEFSKTIKKGREFSNAWWEKQGRENLKDKTFSPVLWYMNMKNRFGWRDDKNKETDLSETEIQKLKQIANSEIDTNL